MLWLLLATTVLTRAYTTLARRLRWLPALHLPGPVQGLTAALLGATAVTTATAGTPAHSAPATGTAHDSDAQPPQASTTAPATRPVSSSQQLILMPADRTSTHTVRRGDTLSKIAAERLGDADRWPEIFALNRGIHFIHTGGILRNPNVIYPGWTLTLPDDATPPTTHRPRPESPPTAPDEPDLATPAPAPTTAPPPSTPHPAPPTATTPTIEPSHAPTPTTASTCASTDNTTSTPTSEPTADRGPRPTSPDRGVALPSGSWISLGLALAITTAAALVWAHRQRRYTAGKPSTTPRWEKQTLAPLPRLIGQIRRALRHTAAMAGETGQDNEPADDAAGDPDGTSSLSNTSSTSQQVTSRDPSATASPATTALTSTHSFGPVMPAPAPLTVWPPAGLGLTGPGADAAARGFLTAALATDTDEHPQARTHAVMTAATAATLLGATTGTLPRTPRLRITPTLDDALNLLEALALHRTRLIDQHETATVADLRADAYEEPLPPVMLLTHPPDRRERPRVAALLTQGQHLDIHGVLLGPWSDGTTVTVNEDGTTTPADGDHASHRADIGRLTVLEPTETLDLLTVLAEAHTGEAPSPAPAEPTPTAHGTGAQPDPRTPLADQHQPATTPADTPLHAAHHEIQALDTGHADALDQPLATSTSATSSTPPAPETGTVTTVAITVLGTPALTHADPQRSLRAKSLELLVYLAARDGTATTEAILDDLLPDAPASKATHRLHTYVSDLRSALRHHGGPGTYLTHPHHRYELNPDRLDVDLWRMRAALRAANTATSKAERVAALRRAVDTYRAPLADGCDYEWLEPHREAVRQQALDAAVALTEELDGQPAEQLAVVDAAIGQHPYAEQLYQVAMRARAHLGDIDGLRTLRRTVTRQLADIDAEPSDDTLTLADQLITKLRPASPEGRASAQGARS
ncbi:DNA-binding transcriptional activator of the SARP family [Micromonospora sediminicola]|uniref:DNA-binding transcriptional activator of the SARP family n=2 Tax=Micromonospora sediminicola TaxID=946078 RepID=A0A1A9B7W9_9ACTN|nr:DNA-binding transcriptional activator of the SARP family [Micromonospora sediminicola]